MLIIVESPAKAKTISKIVGSKYVVKASIGHIRGLSDSKKTADGRSLEVNGIDTENDFLPIYEIDEKKKDVVSELKKLAKASKDGILFATDSDREGEAISWHLADVLGVKDKSTIQRLEFHEITQKAIQEAIANPRKLNLQLVSAQQARQVLDKLVGYKLSPVLWKAMSNFHLSAGRVQSPALHLICLREQEILAFKPEEFWEITGSFSDDELNKAKEIWQIAEDQDNSKKDETLPKNLNLKLSKIKGKKLPEKVTSKQELITILDNLADFPQFKVTSVTQKTEKSYTRPPFITSTLQQAASSKLGLPPKLTMQMAQKLYEGIDIDGQPTALITYMRTDSVNLSQESVELARQFIKKEFPDFLPKESKFYKSKSRNAQEAHEAIRPTNPMMSPQKLRGKLEPRMLKLYELIWTQMIACQMTDEIRERVSFDLENSRTDQFGGSIAWTTHLGFKAITGEEVSLKPKFSLEVGQVLFLQELLYLQKFTSPPSRYSPASLIKKLEELGIGRPSTYASIISTLQDREYVENKQNVMYPSTLGMKINDLLTDNFAEITGSAMTAQMEDNLDQISRGEKEYKQVLSEFWWPFKKEVEEKSGIINENKEKYKSTETDVLDPKHGDLMVLKIGRFGEYFQNPNHPESIYPKNFREYEVAINEARVTYADQTKGKKCEICKKDLIVRVSKASLKPYIACPDYKVGNKHTVMAVNFGPCPKCSTDGRTGKNAGVLVQKKGFRSKSFIGCSLAKDVCGYIQPGKSEEK